jgi:DeoR/GlpR family transcriptional regulator of sugar metabolism
MVNAGGAVSVKALSETLGVSEMTIRRDLDRLASLGYLRRIHGGASPSVSTAYEPPFGVREERNLREKRLIGKEAARLVRDGETLIMDVGTTTLEVARNLNGAHNLTILTNSLLIAMEMASRRDFSVYLLGGLLRGQEMSTVGSVTEAILRSYFADKVIMGTGGISAKSGLSNFDVAEAHVRRVMLESAREAIVVADGSKFSRRAFVSVAPLEKINCVVTDCSAPAEEIEAMREKGIRVILCGRADPHGTGGAEAAQRDGRPKGVE